MTTPNPQPTQMEQRMVTDAMIFAGRDYLLGFGIDDMDDAEIEGIYTAMHAARSPDPEAAKLIEVAGKFLSAADYYIAGLQAVQRRQRVTDLDERHVGYDSARSALQDAYFGRAAQARQEGDK